MKYTLLLALTLFCSPAFAATPTLGADCGVGAVVVGSKNAGKVALGTNTAPTCTLIFQQPWPQAPSCIGVDETSDVRPVGLITTRTSAQITFIYSYADGDVISYLCIAQ